MKTLESVGRYKIESVLGEGAMGVVYRARDPIIKRTVAIKLIKIDDSIAETEKKEFYERFYREAQISGTLNHPNIVGIYDIGEEQGMPYIAMEYVQGRSLSELLAEHGPFDIENVIKMVSQLASALDYAHRKEIVHRDIKPGNIMIDDDFRCKIMDFGIAKLQNSSLTQTGTFLGTPSYSSPEQIMEGKIDHRSDLFSMGIVTFEMITGTLPFKGQTLSSILYKIAHEAPEKVENPERFGIDAPSWNRLFSRVFAKSPDERYQSAKDMSAELTRAVTLTSSQKGRIRQLLVDNSTDTETAIDKQLFRNEYELARAQDNKSDRRTSRTLIWIFIFVLLIGGAFGAYHFTNGEVLKAFNGDTLRKLMTFKVTRQLTVDSVPRGAEVMLDGVAQGLTPLELTLTGEEGEQHRIELALDGFESVSDAVFLTPDLTLEPYKLVSTMVDMEVVTEPAVVNIQVDDEPLVSSAEGPLTIDGARSHKIVFSAEGYRSRTVQLAAGEVITDKISLQPIPKPGTMRLVSDFPVTVTVYKDGKPIERKTMTDGQRLQLDPAVYQVRLSAPRYFFDSSQRLEIVAEQSTRLAMPPLGLIKNLSIDNNWANVYIDGREVGATPILNMKIVTGLHKFRLVGPNGNSREFEREISVGTPLVLKEPKL